MVSLNSTPQPIYRPIAALEPQKILEYWQSCLWKSDLTSIPDSFPRILVSDSARFWDDFNLNDPKENCAAVASLWKAQFQIDLLGLWWTWHLIIQKNQQTNDETLDLWSITRACYLISRMVIQTEDDESEYTNVMLCVCHANTASSRTFLNKKHFQETTGASADPKLSILRILYYIPARILRNGQLLPSAMFPVFDRKFLEPQPENCNQPAYGQYDDFLKGLEDFGNPRKYRSFQDYWGAANALFKRVTDLNVLEQKWKCVIVPRTAGSATASLVEAYDALREQSLPPILHHLLGQAQGTRIDLLIPSDLEVIKSRHIAMVDRGSCNQPPIVFPLDPSQRLALHRFLQLGSESGVIAVSGPPGTGKTDMLRAVISTLWTERALEGGECPIIIACGATNQSVENVMLSFDGAVDCKPGLRSRWIEGVSEYAMIAPAKSRIDEFSSKYQILNLHNSFLKLQGKCSRLENIQRGDLPDLAVDFLKNLLNYLESIETSSNFISPFVTDEPIAQLKKQLPKLSFLHTYQKNNNSLNKKSKKDQDHAMKAMIQVSDFLRTRLNAVCKATNLLRNNLLSVSLDLAESKITEMLEKALEHKGAQIAYRKSLEAIGRRDISAYAESVEGLLDVTIRPLAFHLAARYWESRWIASIPFQTKDMVSDRLNELRRASMLAPCIVSTLHNAPKLLKQQCQENKDEYLHLFGKADLFVVDEAGQAAPEFGGAILSFAHKALVVGDLKQLTPVTSISPVEDKRTILDLWNDSEEIYQTCLRRGVDASSGSIMKLASTGSSFSEEGRNGILLRNHYRCARSIINFCIELLYNEHDRSSDGTILLYELMPQIEDPTPASLDSPPSDPAQVQGQFPLPPMGFVQCGSPNDEPEPEKGTWKNLGEAEKLVDWLQDNGKKLAQWCARVKGCEGEDDLADIVAIVTPFRGQADSIRSLIAERLDAKFPYIGNKKLSERMTIGTVHTLQGAERAVILFSAVNKECRATRKSHTDGKVFIDRDGGNLLNVAVSRAKKSFILFGHADLFFSPQALDPENNLPTAILGRYLAGIATEVENPKPGVKISPHTLVVVESPHKAKEIQKYLPFGFEVFGSGGHIRNLASLNLTPENHFEPLWKLEEHYPNQQSTRLALQRTMSRLLQTRHLILATDPDPQGEAIAWHILQVLKKHSWFNHLKTVSRVKFSSITEDEIRNSFGQLREAEIIPLDGKCEPENALDMGLVHAALAQRILDGVIGRHYKNKHKLDTGRVQAPLLRLLSGQLPIGEEGEEPFLIDVAVPVGEALTPAYLVKLTEEGRSRPASFKTLSDAQKVSQEIHGSQLRSLASIGTSYSRRIQPPTGLGTVDVLMIAWRRYGFSPDKTSEILKSLYEHRFDDSYADNWSIPDEALVSLQNGRLELTEAGERQVLTLEELESDLSHYEFSHQLEQSLDEIARGTRSYEDVVAQWTNKILGLSEIPQVAEPTGKIVDAEGREAFPTQLTVSENREWVLQSDGISELVGILRTLADSETKAAASLESSGMSDPLQHPPLMPLTLDLHPDDSSIREMLSPDELKIYSIIWRRTIASVFPPSHIEVTSYLFQIESSCYGVVLESARILEAGWFEVDTGAQAELSERYASQRIINSLLSENQRATVLVMGGIRRKGLLRPTPDKMLMLMKKFRLGRPSTFATHLTRLMPF